MQYFLLWNAGGVSTEGAETMPNCMWGGGGEEAYNNWNCVLYL